MHEEINSNIEIKSNDDLTTYYLQVINYRNSHKDNSSDIARLAFDKTHPNALKFNLSKDLSFIRFEFGSLEAPGMPDDEHSNMTPEEYCDYLWERLRKIVIQEQNKKG